MSEHSVISFTIAGVAFEYDAQKEKANIQKHGISFRAAARVFFDDDYIEEVDRVHSDDEQRYHVIGDTSAGNARVYAAIGNVERFFGNVNDVLYVVYTERMKREADGKPYEVIRIISARLANSFERGVYYGQYI